MALLKAVVDWTPRSLGDLGVLLKLKSFLAQRAACDVFVRVPTIAQAVHVEQTLWFALVVEQRPLQSASRFRFPVLQSSNFDISSTKCLLWCFPATLRLDWPTTTDQTLHQVLGPRSSNSLGLTSLSRLFLSLNSLSF